MICDKRKMRRLAVSAALGVSLCGHSQTLEKMNWFNEPEVWSVDNGVLTMDVTPKSDYWRISHYGFTVDDAPFFWAEYGGEFEAKVKISGEYKKRFTKRDLWCVWIAKII